MKTRNNGFILFTVLMIIVLLTALLVRFNYASRGNLRSVNNFTRQIQALNCARAGLNIAMATVSKNSDPASNQSLNSMIGQKQIYDVNPGKCTVEIFPENGKLNINALKDKNGRINRRQVDQFLRLIDLLNSNNHGDKRISYSLAPAIIDWTDPDNEITQLDFVGRDNRGAESNYYQNLSQKQNCPNRPLETIDELLQVKGITAELLYRNITPDNINNSLTNLLTVYGDDKIDINSAPPTVIQSVSELITSETAKSIIQYRQRNPFSSLSELNNISSLPTDIINALIRSSTTQPARQYYKIVARGDVNEVSKTITAIVKRNSTEEKCEMISYKESR